MSATSAFDLPPAPLGELVLAHLSDPHLTSLVGVDPWTLRDKRILGWLSWRRKRRAHHQRHVVDALVADIRSQGVDHIAVTGDLTHIGTSDELDDARQWLEELGEARAVSVIPGNHDRYVRDASRQVERRWAPWSASDAGIATRRAPVDAEGADTNGSMPWLRLRGPVALIGLDSAEPAPWLMATGRLGPGQLERLRRILEAAGSAGYLRCVLVHHAPRPGLDRTRKRLVDAPELAELLDATGTELVLHGHGHHLRIERHGVGVVAQAPSASSSETQGAARAAWIRHDVRRDASGFTVTLTARAPGDVLDHQVFSFPEAAPAPSS